MVIKMRIKLDGELFREEEMEELMDEMEKSGVTIQVTKKSRAGYFIHPPIPLSL